MIMITGSITFFRYKKNHLINKKDDPVKIILIFF